MATTPNFGWVTPSPTDFVTDLPADFETFADAVDADVQLIKNTADAALPETLIDAAGDLIYGSAADTAARLAIGTAGQVLAVNSGATAPEWIAAPSGGATLLSTTSLSGATVDITGISQDYTNLFIEVYGITLNVSRDPQLTLRNGTTAQNVDYGGLRVHTTSTVDAQNYNNQSLIKAANDNQFLNVSTANMWNIDIKNYTRAAAGERSFTTNVAFFDGSGNQSTIVGFGRIRGSSAIDALRFTVVAGDTYSTGTVKVWGY